ncbi:MAG: hypothetical protein DRP95_00755 [Candidatus Latescibacterota bacterium]|nr:MAG: hypothetical protein DRP95_00755 [Candidatus Latescibacterota bacterium]
MPGWRFTVAEVFSSFCVAFLTGLLARTLLKGEVPAASEGCRHRGTSGWKRGGIREVLRYGFVEVVDDVGPYILLGLFGAGLVTALVPAEIVREHMGQGILPILAMVLLAAPMYICSTASVPLVVSLIAKGFHPCAGLAFLIAGPATNLSTVLAIAKSMGKGTAVLYITSIVSSSVLIAYGLDLVGWL